MEESGVALIRYALDLRHEGSVANSAKLNRLLEDMVRGWVPAVESGLAEIGERRSAARAARYADAFPAGYRAGAGPVKAAPDILQLHSLTRCQTRTPQLYHTPQNRDKRPNT